MSNHDRIPALSEEGFSNEDELQALIARDHSLLCGDKITPEDPRRWILVDREFNVVANSKGAFRWRMDHLFIDQDGLPTIVEAKQGGNREKRRTIVGQVLEYAAYSMFFPQKNIRAMFEANVDDPTATMKQLLGQGVSGARINDFWNKVSENMARGHLRLLLIADHLPNETCRVAKFLNSKLRDIDVFAIEVENPSNIDIDMPSRLSHRAHIRVAPGDTFGKLTIEERRMLPEPSLPVTAAWLEEIRYCERSISRNMTPRKLHDHLPLFVQPAMRQLMKVAHDAGACFETEKYSVVINGKTDAWNRKRPIKLVWLDPPAPHSTRYSYGKPGYFTFGYGGGVFNQREPGPELLASLQRWNGLFENRLYERRTGDAVYNQQWILSYAQVVRDLAVLCDHLIETIDDLRTLDPHDQ